ncbi:MAG: hypothetical protein GY856_48155 [bacterium]|nr:hypothetical protein [bacterium]
MGCREAGPGWEHRDPPRTRVVLDLMSRVIEDIRTRHVTVPIAGGEASLEVPYDISDQTLNKEVGVQDFIRQRLLDFIASFERIIESNRELFFCSEEKLVLITRDFLAACAELRQFISNLSTYHSAISKLEEARENVEAFFYRHISIEIDGIEAVQRVIASEMADQGRIPQRELNLFRKKLGKGAGLVRTELQKIFAHLLAHDPRNIYRTIGERSEQEVLFLQFKRDVEVTEQLYKAVRALDTYMRGAIIPSDLLKLTAERIRRERSVVCLFEPDYSLFLNALLDEIAEQLLAELYEILDLDGIWYDDYENIRGKAKILYDVCSTFKAHYLERYGLREEIRAKAVITKGLAGKRRRDPFDAVLAVFNTYRFEEMADNIMKIDQTLVDLEGSLLQWEKGIARRAFARVEWSAAEPFRRRAVKSFIG